MADAKLTRTEHSVEPAPVSEAVVLALASAAGIAIAPEHLPGVALNLARLLAQGQLVMAVPLGSADEPAAIFAP